MVKSLLFATEQEADGLELHNFAIPFEDSAVNLQAQALVTIRRMVWGYFWLVLFEGALRKWIVPSLANPLLLIRDPVVLAIYWVAWRNRLFPRGTLLVLGGILAWFSIVGSFMALQTASLPQSLAVTLYGFHANFVHLALIPIMGKCLNATDVRKFGFWILALALPLALIMALQYQSPGTAWINAGAGEDAKQIAFVGKHVRASATFSFATGPALFYSLVSGFLIYGFFSHKQYPRWLTIAAMTGVGLAGVTAGSRTMLGTVGIVAAFAVFIGLVLVPRLIFKTVQFVGVILFVGLSLNQMDVVQDASQRMAERLDNANMSERQTGGLSTRVLEGYTAPLSTAFIIPAWGVGLGAGTIVGSVLLGGEKNMYLYGNAELELVRNVIESGPILGLAFIFFRWSIAFSVLRVCFLSAKRGETLPLLLFTVCGLTFINGNLGQATTIGFGVFTAGLCLAATKIDSSASNGADIPRVVGAPA